VVTDGVRAGDAASAGCQVTLCDPIWHAGSRSGAVLLAQTAILLYLPNMAESKTPNSSHVWLPHDLK